MKKTIDFIIGNGRINRKRYLILYLVFISVYSFLFIYQPILHSLIFYILLVLVLSYFISISLMRLRDSNRSGFELLIMIPMIASETISIGYDIRWIGSISLIILFYYLSLSSTEDNKWGLKTDNNSGFASSLLFILLLFVITIIPFFVLQVIVNLTPIQ